MTNVNTLYYVITETSQSEDVAIVSGKEFAKKLKAHPQKPVKTEGYDPITDAPCVCMFMWA